MSELNLLETPITRISLSDSVYEKLLEAIVSGKFPGGLEISEAEIARRLGVSRTPVHDAVVRLVTDGFLRQSADRKLQVVQFAADELIAVYHMRRLLEGEAARLAATRMDAAVLLALREQADELLTLPDSSDWNEREIEYDLEFHETIATASGNPLLERDVGRYRLLIRGFCRITGTTVNLRAALDEHITILDALERRDGRAAMEAMHAHIEARLLGVQAELGKGDVA